MEPDSPDPSQTPSPSRGLTPSRAAGSGSRPAGGWQPPSPAELQREIAAYKILELLGHGGMGAVYKGWQTSLDRYVAIKILPPDVDDADAQFTARFKQEARTMAKFQHPGIVSVYDAGDPPRPGCDFAHAAVAARARAAAGRGIRAQAGVARAASQERGHACRRA